MDINTLNLDQRVYWVSWEPWSWWTWKEVANVLWSKDDPKLQWRPNLPGRYKLKYSWKVRELYTHPDDSSLYIIIASDRISTHDVVHYGTVPWKGKALTQMSKFWFGDIKQNPVTHRIQNQLSGATLPDDFPEEYKESTVVVKKMKALPIEAIVRGYLYGSALKWYNSTTWQLDTGEYIWEGLKKCSKFQEAMFTPSTKSNDKDINISFEKMVEILKEWLPNNGYASLNAQNVAEDIRWKSLAIYNHANNVAQEKWLILGDTKIEFGLDELGRVVIIDELCTADSSRLWTANTVIEWEEPESHDKQPVRDYVIDYWKNHPDKNRKYYWDEGFEKYPVEIPQAILDQCDERYQWVNKTFQEAT